MKLISILKMSSATFLLSAPICLLISATSTANAASVKNEMIAPSAAEFKVKCDNKTGNVACVVTCDDKHVYETGDISASGAKAYCVERGSGLVAPATPGQSRKQARQAR